MSHFALILFLFSTFGWAEGSIGGGGASDLLSDTRYQGGVFAPDAHPRIQIDTTCTTPDGKEFSESDGGYRECLAAKKLKKN